ncbi:MAG: CCA tRNA nucleotidyltransferase [Deltaproteobacteria bacterium]|nr:CCA tRNA nucleotidyltransferase [Deltaproteobacteria bacterium]
MRTLRPPKTTVDAEAIPSAVKDLCGRLASRGHGSWIVGGCVRDHLLGRAVNDWDLCTTARPRELLEVFPRAVPTGIDHGTLTVVVDRVPYEVTTLRGEGTYTDGRRPDRVYFLDDVTQDLARRDFTVNAIAYDPLGGVLVDPFGGRQDLEDGVLRAVGDPFTRFSEDGLRILRGARFVATLGFELDPATEAAMERALPVFRKVSAERVRDEWCKTFKAPQPSRAFEVMRRRGILAVTCPPLLEAVGCAQGDGRAYDVWTHTMRAVDACPKDTVLRTAAVFHDVGKARTRAVDPATGAVTFPSHELVGASLADQWLQDYRYSNDERQRVVHLIRHHRVGYQPSWSDGAVRRYVRAVGLEALKDLAALWAADARARGPDPDPDLAVQRALLERVEAVLERGRVLGPRDLAVDGTALMKDLGLKPSKQLGELLAQLLERAMDDPSVNTREGLLALARERLAAG